MGRWIPHLVVLASLSIGITACSKREPGSPSTASVRFTLPNSQAKANALAMGTITRIMVNITGSGITPARVWICDHSEQACPQNGGTIALEVPSGAARMIQVLVVMKNSGAESIYYGDAVKDLTAAEETVSVEATSIGILNGYDSQVIGRYKDAAGNYPTADLNLRFSPGSGKPSMIVERSRMIAGYLNVFFKEGIELNWEFASSGVPVSLPELGLSTLPSQVTKLKIPAHYYCSSSGTNCGSDRKPNTYLYVGLFGPGQSGGYACYNTLELINNLYANSDGTGALSWAIGTLGALELGPMSGGTSSTTPCSTGSAFVDRIMVQGAQAGKGETAIASMVGAYVSNSGDAMTWTHASGPVNITANYLPGIVSADGITATDVFYKNSSDPNTVIRNTDDIECSSIQTTRGYTALTHTESSSTILASLTTTAAIGVLPTDLSVVFCPYHLNSDGTKTYYDKFAAHKFNIPEITSITPTVFVTAGVSSFTIPGSCNSVDIKSWGGGGGGGSAISTNPGGPGGGGGFVAGRFPAIPGQLWTIGVGGGGGGASGTASVPTPGGTIGGGVGSTSDSPGSSAGGGGGVTYVRNAGGVMLLAAGGGGGGGAGNFATPGGKGGSGGANGDAAGDGGGLNFGYGAQTNAVGAGQFLGASGQIPGYAGNPYGEGAGSPLNGSGYAGGGGGGAGYYGGGSGSLNHTNEGGSGGGGGSNYVDTTLAITSTMNFGVGSNAAAQSDPDRTAHCPACAMGGSGSPGAMTAQAGAPGFVVIRCLP